VPSPFFCYHLGTILFHPKTVSSNLQAAFLISRFHQVSIDVYCSLHAL
jgi:hypothetical protein